LLAQPAGQENRCIVLTNGAMTDSFFTFRAYPPKFRVALGFPEALGDLGQAPAPQSHDCPPQKSRYPSAPRFLESALFRHRDSGLSLYRPSITCIPSLQTRRQHYAPNVLPLPVAIEPAVWLRMGEFVPADFAAG